MQIIIFISITEWDTDTLILGSNSLTSPGANPDDHIYKCFGNRKNHILFVTCRRFFCGSN